jgi:hypothetical protein
VKTCLAVMSAGLLLLALPALAKPAKPDRRADVKYAQSYYDYHSASSVREEFDPVRRRSWHEGHRGYRHGFAERGRVVESLTDDFTGGVGYGTNGDVGFVDGYGQVHFYGGYAPQNPIGRPHRFGMGLGRGLPRRR